MIIKKINFEDLSDRQLYLKLKQKFSQGSQSRMNYLQQNQRNEHIGQVKRQETKLKESISFNDKQCFNNQSLLLHMDKKKVDFPMHRTYIRKITNKKRQQQQSSDPPFQLMTVHTQKINNIFQAFNQQQNNASIDKNLPYAENNYTEVNRRNYSSISFQNKRQFYNTVNLNEQAKYSKTKQNIMSKKSKMKQSPKLHKYNKSCCEINPYTKKKYYHEQFIKQKIPKNSKIRSFDYSIIKPNQIVSAPLRDRNYLKIQFPFDNTTTFKRNYPQLMQKIKKKEEMLKKQILLQGERQKRQKQQRHLQIRRKMHSSYGNRIRLIVEQSNEVLPWQVQGLSNLADII